jgi:hypothetical protein
MKSEMAGTTNFVPISINSQPLAVEGLSIGSYGKYKTFHQITHTEDCNKYTKEHYVVPNTNIDAPSMEHYLSRA